jgi:exodeoxyribonuclease VII large subunit
MLERESTAWSVAELVGAISQAVAARFAAVTVLGEISGLTRASSGHCYLGLKDADGAGVVIRCAMFRRALSVLDFTPSEGQRVEVRGRVAVYEPRGELQFVIESMRPAGAGALYEQFVQLRAKLEREGLFAAHTKQALPVFPLRVGVVTSLGGAVLHDVVTVLARRAPQVHIVVYPSMVQGNEAPLALVQALQTADARSEVDVLIVCRGGGSLQDLWAFNDERVVRAIAALSLPVVCGVGHETDVTLADLAADVRAATPSAAAELVAPTQAACLVMLQASAKALCGHLQRQLDIQAQRLDHAGLRLRTPREAIRQRTQQLRLLGQALASGLQLTTQRLHGQHTALQARLAQSTRTLQARQVQRLDQAQSRLNALNPAQVLSRGYAWLLDPSQGTALVSSTQLSNGQAIEVVLADGRAHANITAIYPARV